MTTERLGVTSDIPLSRPVLDASFLSDAGRVNRDGNAPTVAGSIEDAARRSA